jgi:integrase
MLAMLFACGCRRSELVSLELDEVQMRQGHWAVVDLIGKGGRIRTVPILLWVKAALDRRMLENSFRCTLCRHGRRK